MTVHRARARRETSRSTEGADPGAGRRRAARRPDRRVVARRVLIAALGLLATAGCFQVRGLDRDFDAAPPDAATPDVGSPDDCLRVDPTCDGHDDDCDGRLDEDFFGEQTCGEGACVARSEPASCVSGFVIPCRPGRPGDEACNGVDDDCDGRVDERLRRDCGGPDACEPGTERCDAGAWAGCDAVLPAAETCNGLDDDCDGATDELEPRPCDVGGCASGTQVCADGVWAACAPGPLPDESCNGSDDDCDGAVDEGLGDEPCGTEEGVCVSGRTRCVGAVLDCEGAIEPSPETCDGLDEDCDGEVDESDDGSPCGACALAGAAICAEGRADCGPAPASLCVRPVLTIGGGDGDGLGRLLVAIGDVDDDGIGDFAAGGHAVVMAFSGADGSPLWRRPGNGELGDALVAADLDGDGVREVIAGHIGGAPQGRVVVYDGRRGDLRDDATGEDGMTFGRALAAVDRQQRVAIGDPEAGDGRVRAVPFRNGEFGPLTEDFTVPEATGFGAVIAGGLDRDDEPHLAATVQSDGENAVVAVYGPFGGEPDVQLLFGPEPGIGGRLAIGRLLPLQPSVHVATHVERPAVDLVGLPADGASRLALAAPAQSLALLPPPRPLQAGFVAIGQAGAVQLLRPDADGHAIGFVLPAPREAAGFGAAVAGSERADGQGVHWLAVGAPEAAEGRGRVLVYRIE